jgi:hypothetical protein
MARNVRAHRINYRALAARGAWAGVLASLIMVAIAAVAAPLIEANTDAWSFPKVVSSIVLGEEAASPLAGFDALPVVLGLLLHLAIGAFFGAVFACIVGFLDVEETVPVVLAGIVYGVIVFLTTYVMIGQLLFPAIDDLPLVVSFWNHVAFGITTGVVLGSWADTLDADHYKDREAVRSFDAVEVTRR